MYIIINLDNNWAQAKTPVFNYIVHEIDIIIDP